MESIEGFSFFWDLTHDRISVFIVVVVIRPFRLSSFPSSLVLSIYLFFT